MPESEHLTEAIASGYGWRPVVGYEGIYEVSWCGCVRRIVGGVGTKAGKNGKPRCLKAFPGAGKSKLYYRVQLSCKGVRETIPVHTMSAKAWHGPQPEDEFGKFEVHHRDNDISNNSAENLEWLSGEDNRKEQWHRYMTKGEGAG